MRAVAIAPAVAALAVACSPSARVTSCDDALAGVWHTPAGDWMLLDRGATLEGYPLFDDAHPPLPDASIVLAPRALDLRRERGELTGELARRYMRAGDACVAKVPVRVTACTADTLELVLADPSPPTQFAPCAWSARTNPSRRERWTR